MADELQHTLLPVEPDAIAPDGSHVRVLCHGERGSMAHFELGPGEISRAVVHRTVDELWYVLEGLGRMWCQSADRDGVEVELRPGTALAIPVGTRFQFRNTGRSPLVAVAGHDAPVAGRRGGDGDRRAVGADHMRRRRLPTVPSAIGLGGEVVWCRS